MLVDFIRSPHIQHKYQEVVLFQIVVLPCHVFLHIVMMYLFGEHSSLTPEFSLLPHWTIFLVLGLEKCPFAAHSARARKALFVCQKKVFFCIKNIYFVYSIYSENNFVTLTVRTFALATAPLPACWPNIAFGRLRKKNKIRMLEGLKI